MQGETHLVRTTRWVSYSGTLPEQVATFEGVRLEWNLGHMVNLGPRYAAGGVVSFGTRRTSSLALKLRGRRRLGDGVSVELEGGYLWTDLRYPPASFGVTADVRLNIRDQGMLYLRWDGLSLPSRSFPPAGFVDPGGFERALSVGAGLGSLPALAGTEALGLAMIVVFVAWVFSEHPGS